VNITRNGRLDWGEVWLRETKKYWIEDVEEHEHRARWNKDPDEPGGNVTTCRQPGFNTRPCRANTWELDLSSIRPLTPTEIRAPLQEHADETKIYYHTTQEEADEAKAVWEEAQAELARFDKTFMEDTNG